MRTGTCDRCGGSFVDRSPAQKRRFCSDNCRKRQSAEESGWGVCADCGGHTDRPRNIRCAACHLRLVKGERQSKREVIAALWGRGFLSSQIAERLNTTRGQILKEVSLMRGDGWDLEVRRPDRQGVEALTPLFEGRDAARKAAA